MVPVFRRNLLGYTLIELTVVLAIMGVIAAIAFWGLRGTNDADILDNQQKELLSALRNTQTKILAGSDGIATRSASFTNNASTYTVDGVTVGLGKNVITVSPSVGALNVCFVNVNLSAFSPSPYCPCNNSYACDGSGSPVSANKLVLTISSPNSTLIKSVAIEGSGIFVGRVYGL